MVPFTGYLLHAPAHGNLEMRLGAKDALAEIDKTPSLTASSYEYNAVGDPSWHSKNRSVSLSRISEGVAVSPIWIASK